MTDNATSTVVLVDPRFGAVLPAAALPALRSAAAVFVASDLPEFAGHGEPVPEPAELLAGPTPVVLIAADPQGHEASALLAAGAAMVTTNPVPGRGLLAAVELMRRLRAPGGCPWDAEQTHPTLRQYLIEETYELLEAIDDGDRAALREELGDVLLQVLFHAAIAAEDDAEPFTIDDVADGLVRKLVGRHPHLFGSGDPEVRDAASQNRRWHELKRIEKRRQSSVDGVPFGQPAAALAAKLTHRVTHAGLPVDLLPSDALFALVAETTLAGIEPEGVLRDTARRFAGQVREAERAARDAGLDPAGMDADTWRKFWPREPERC